MNMQSPLARETLAQATDTVTIRPGRPEDAEGCGAVLQRAFGGEFESRVAARDAAAAKLGDAAIFSLVAETSGGVVGVAFLHEGDRVRALGPVAVDPDWRGGGIGRRLAQAALERAGEAAQVRTTIDAGNARAMALAASLGFLVKEPLLLLSGMPTWPAAGAGLVRRLRNTDIPVCAALCKAVHGITRTHELASSNPSREPMVIEREGRITGYMTAPSSWSANHGVAESPADLRGLIAGCAAITRAPASLLLPTRSNAMLAWGLEHGLRITRPMTLMARGAYQQPRMTWFPSAAY